VAWHIRNAESQSAIRFSPRSTKGDFDLDGHVNVGDISMMMTAFADRTKFQQSRGLSVADFAVMGNLDGGSFVTNMDMQALIVSLANAAGGGSLTPVPEPAAWVLLMLGGLAIAYQMRFSRKFCCNG
jgi:hypothetical protein